MKKKYGWDPEASFVVPEEVSSHMRQAIDKGKKAEAKWQRKFKKFAKTHPELAQQFQDAADGRIGINIDELLPKFEADSSIATRKASGQTLNALMPKLPLIMGGSADLTPSNLTQFDGAENFQKDKDISNIRLTVDTKKDFILISKIIENFHDRWTKFDLKDVITFINQNPHLLKINAQYERNEGYFKSLKEDKIINT